MFTAVLMLFIATWPMDTTENEAMKAINWELQWVSFGDEETWKLKGDSPKSQCISNVMV
jgi:hypothetical protein